MIMHSSDQNAILRVQFNRVVCSFYTVLTHFSWSIFVPLVVTAALACQVVLSDEIDTAGSALLPPLEDPPPITFQPEISTDGSIRLPDENDFQQGDYSVFSRWPSEEWWDEAETEYVTPLFSVGSFAEEAERMNSDGPRAGLIRMMLFDETLIPKMRYVAEEQPDNEEPGNEEQPYYLDPGNPAGWGEGETANDGDMVPVPSGPVATDLTPELGPPIRTDNESAEDAPQGSSGNEASLPIGSTYDTEKLQPQVADGPVKDTPTGSSGNDVPLPMITSHDSVNQHPIIQDYMNKITAAVEAAKDAIKTCEEEVYRGNVAEAKEQTEVLPIIMWRMTDEEASLQQHHLEFAKVTAQSLLESIPAYPEPCESNDVWYPELEYVADQYRIAMRLRIWAHYVCNLAAQHKFVDDFSALERAMDQMRGVAQILT
ncbi:hypothetical protein BOV90_08355, partial [Solemya velum gill symbiont]